MPETRNFYQPVRITGALTVTGTLTVGGVALTNFVKGVASGYAVARGTQIATSTAAITTGLTTITGFAVSGVGGTATKANAAVCCTAAASSGTLTVKRYKITAPSTATLVAATTAGTVSWVAVGTI